MKSPGYKVRVRWKGHNYTCQHACISQSPCDSQGDPFQWVGKL